MKVLRALSSLAAASFVSVVLVTFVPHWWPSLLEHFRFHYVVAGLPVIVAAYWLSPRWFHVAFFAWLVNFLIVVPGMRPQTTDRPGTHVRLLLSNVLTSNRHYDRVLALVAETKPDIIALVETDRRWFEHLPLEGYHRIEHEHGGNFGLALYARGALRGNVEFLGSKLPTIVANVTLPSGPRVSVIVTHPMPPLGAKPHADQLSQFAAIAQRVHTLPSPVILAGDFNAAPWSRAFAQLAGESGLCDTRSSYQGSFPADSFVTRIPIDHVLVSCDTGVSDRWIGPDVGSDHLPVIVDLSY